MSQIQSRSARDEEVIDLSSAQDVSFWLSELEVSKQELTEAVQAAGPVAGDVRLFLGTRFTRF